VDLGGALGDGEPVGCRRQRRRRGEGGQDSGLVEIDTADPGLPDRGGDSGSSSWSGMKVTRRSPGGAEPVNHAGEPGDDVRNLSATRPQRSRVVCDRPCDPTVVAGAPRFGGADAAGIATDRSPAPPSLITSIDLSWTSCTAPAGFGGEGGRARATIPRTSSVGGRYGTPL
jgi:hypothetical protein